MGAARSIAAGLRLGGLALRLLLVFVLAAYLPPDAVGAYGLLSATAAFAVLVVGLEFSTYSTRQLIRAGVSSAPVHLRSHAALAGVSYVVLGPALVLFSISGLLPWTLIWWLVALVPLEHLGAELDRILIALQRQRSAAVGMFVRQGALTLVLAPVLATVPGARSLGTVLVGWVLFDVIGVAAGIAFIARAVQGQPSGRVDWRWVRRGLAVAAPFLLSTLCIRAVFTFDRQLVGFLGSLEVLAAYTLYLTIAAGMTQLLYAGVQQSVYPRLVALAHHDDRAGFRRLLRSFAVQTAVAIVGFVLVALLVQPLVVSVLSEEVYREQAWILPWALFVVALYNLSTLPHYALYALGRDRVLIAAAIAAVAAFAAAAGIALAIGAAPAAAALVAVGAASATLGVVKAIALGARPGAVGSG